MITFSYQWMQILYHWIAVSHIAGPFLWQIKIHPVLLVEAILAGVHAMQGTVLWWCSEQFFPTGLQPPEITGGHLLDVVIVLCILVMDSDSDALKSSGCLRRLQDLPFSLAEANSLMLPFSLFVEVLNICIVPKTWSWNSLSADCSRVMLLVMLQLCLTEPLSSTSKTIKNLLMFNV